MPTLKLSTKQAELMTNLLVNKVLQGMEEKGGAWIDATAHYLLDAWDEMAPVVKVVRELSADQQTDNLDLLTETAADWLSNCRGSAGYALTVKRRIEVGEVVQWLAADDKSAEDAIKRCEAEAAENAEEADIAWSITEAVRQAQNEVKARNGDARAKESLATIRRWEEENRRLAEAVSA